MTAHPKRQGRIDRIARLRAGTAMAMRCRPAR